MNFGTVTVRLDPEEPDAVVYALSTGGGEVWTLKIFSGTDSGGFYFSLTHHGMGDSTIVADGEDFLRLMQLLGDARVFTAAASLQERLEETRQRAARRKREQENSPDSLGSPES